MNWLVDLKSVASVQKAFILIGPKQTSSCPSIFKNGNLDVLVATDVAARVLDILQVWPIPTTTIFHKIPKLCSPYRSVQGVLVSESIYYFIISNEMGYLQIIENLTKKRMKGLKPASAGEAFKLKSKLLKKIEQFCRRIRRNFENLLRRCS